MGPRRLRVPAIESLRRRATAALGVGAVLLAAACGSGERKTAYVAPPPAEGTYKVGKPYDIDGITYRPMIDESYDETGIASWYGPKFHGKRTANGEFFDMNAVSARAQDPAHALDGAGHQPGQRARGLGSRQRPGTLRARAHYRHVAPRRPAPGLSLQGHRPGSGPGPGGGKPPSGGARQDDPTAGLDAERGGRRGIRASAAGHGAGRDRLAAGSGRRVGDGQGRSSGSISRPALS